MESVDERSGHRQEGRHQNTLFYSDDGMVASPDPIWPQGELITLVGLFDRVGLKIKIGKTVVMVFRLYQAAGMHSEAAYGKRMTGAGTSYLERQKVQVQCMECGEEMALGYLAVHL